MSASKTAVSCCLRDSARNPKRSTCTPMSSDTRSASQTHPTLSALYSLSTRSASPRRRSRSIRVKCMAAEARRRPGRCPRVLPADSSETARPRLLLLDGVANTPLPCSDVIGVMCPSTDCMVRSSLLDELFLRMLCSTSCKELDREIRHESSEVSRVIPSSDKIDRGGEGMDDTLLDLDRRGEGDIYGVASFPSDSVRITGPLSSYVSAEFDKNRAIPAKSLRESSFLATHPSMLSPSSE